MPVKSTRITLTLAAAFIWLAQSVEPWPGPALNLDRLTAEANLIAVGQITSVQEIGKTNVQFGDRTFHARAMAAELRVDRMLKGPAEGPSTFLKFHFILPDEFIGWRSVTVSSYQVFFLAQTSGELKLANPYYPSVEAIPGIESQEGTAIERVIAQLGAVLESPRTAVEQKRQAVFALTRTKNSAAIRALSRVAEAKDSTFRLYVVAALLEHNDISTLQFAEDTLLKSDPTLPSDLLHGLYYAISVGVKDERAVPSLARLLHGGNVEIRRAAASALMHTGSTSSVEPLLSSLNDLDFEVRYYSVVGLAEITGQTEWRPNMDDFKSDERKYVNHWHDWSKSR